MVEFCEVIEDQKIVFCEEIELIEDQKVEFCEVIEDQKVVCEELEDKNVEFCEKIEDQMVEFCEVIKDQKVVFCEIIEDQKVEDINMLKSSGNESDKINLTKRELRVIARKRGVKNYENLSKRELIKEIKKLPQFKKTGFDKIVFEKYPKKMITSNWKGKILEKVLDLKKY